MNSEINKKFKILIVGARNNFSLESIYFKSLKHINYKVDFLNIEKSIYNRAIAIMIRYFSEFNYKFLRKKVDIFF